MFVDGMNVRYAYVDPRSDGTKPKHIYEADPNDDTRTWFIPKFNVLYTIIAFYASGSEIYVYTCLCNERLTLVKFEA